MTTLKRVGKRAGQGSNATLEGAVLRALSGQLAPQKPKHLPKSATDKVWVSPGLTASSADKLAKAARALREQLSDFGLLRVETVRVRPRGSDRQLRVEYAVDPEDRHSVLMRVSLASDQPLAAAPTMLTTQEAADALNVSRPYVIRLVDDEKKVSGVERTESGHRRIPLAEVERIQAEMRSTRRKALDSIDAATQDLRERELRTATTKSKRRWVAKQG